MGFSFVGLSDSIVSTDVNLFTVSNAEMAYKIEIYHVVLNLPVFTMFIG